MKPPVGGPVVDQYDGRLPAQVDRADGIAVVEDVGGVLAMLGALVGRLGGKTPGRAVEAEAGAVAARLHGPVALQEPAVAVFVDPVVVGAGHRLHLPHALSLKRRAAVGADPPAGRAGSRVAERQALPGLERVALHPADPGLMEGRARAQHRRRRDPAGDGQVSAGAKPGEAQCASTCPARTATLSHSGTGALSRVGCMSAPVTATTASRPKRSWGPVNWHSRPAASAGLPTARLARRKDQSSIGPENGNPCSQ